VLIDEKNVFLLLQTLQTPWIMGWSSVLALMLITVYGLHLSNACRFNRCLCLPNRIYCDAANAVNLRFSRQERRQVTQIYLTGPQARVLAPMCTQMPRLRYMDVTFKTDTNKATITSMCPRLPCLQVRVYCR
jgi:hypothetical protein